MAGGGRGGRGAVDWGSCCGWENTRQVRGEITRMWRGSGGRSPHGPLPPLASPPSSWLPLSHLTPTSPLRSLLSIPLPSHLSAGCRPALPCPLSPWSLHTLPSLTLPSHLSAGCCCAPPALRRRRERKGSTLGVQYRVGQIMRHRQYEYRWVGGRPPHQRISTGMNYGKC